MRKGRGIDHEWQICKYLGDIALYARCKCGFYYPCSSSIRNPDGTWGFKQEITKLYHYCPSCGAHKKYYNETPQQVNKYLWE